MVTLNIKQQEAVDAVISTRSNVFIFGCAGTGKSEVIKVIVAGAPSSSRVAVCATTGAAAALIDGKTVHSFFGTGLFDDSTSVQGILDRVRAQPSVVAAIRGLGMLIIDEISMATSSLVRVLKAVLEEFRTSQGPYGGVQIVLVGDLKQLPPVVVKKASESIEQHKARVSNAWCFRADEWPALNLRMVELTEIVRTGDRALQTIVANLANGRMTADDIKTLKNNKKDTDAKVKEHPQSRVVLMCHQCRGR